MSDDTTRKAATLAILFISIAVNGAANVLPINGQTTASISDRFAVYVVPAGYVFAIWGLIYLGQVAFAIDQAIASGGRLAVFRRIGWLPALAATLNAAWILAWHYEVFSATVAIMAGLLVTLIAIHRRLRAADAAGEIDPRARWTTRIPYSVYLGWITVATIANVAAVLQWAGFDGFGIAGEVWAVAVLLTGLAIATAFVVRERDAAYGLVIVWAYAGIAVKESGVLPVAIVTGAGAIWIAGLAAWTVVQRRRGSFASA